MRFQVLTSLFGIIKFLLPCCCSLELKGLSRIYIELGGNITLLPASGEPAFSVVAHHSPVCVLGRTNGQFTLDLPGWTRGTKGDDNVYIPAYVDGDAIHCQVPRVKTAGLTSVQLSMQGPFNGSDPRWAPAVLEHAFAFAPAFGRRPYCREAQAAIVIVSADDLAGHQLQLEATIGGMSLVKAPVQGGRSQRIVFSLDGLPKQMAADVNISLLLNDGRAAWHVRRFLRAAPPSDERPTTTVVQVDHELRALRVDGVPLVANGWFHGDWDHESAGLPPIPFMMGPWKNSSGGESLSDHVLRRANLGQQSNVAQFGRTGLTFVRAGWANSVSPDRKVSKTRLLAYLDAAAAAGVYVLLNVGVDALANSIGNSTNLSTCNSGTGDPQINYCTRVRDMVLAARGHQAVAGYYGCDDCCHVGKGRLSLKEYANIAQIKNSIFELDPHSLVFGTIACGSTWLWQEAGVGLGLDVVLKESYGGGVGGSHQCLPAYATAFGDCGHLRAFPMIWEPLWNMPSPLRISSPLELRSHVYAGIIAQSTHSNNFYVYNPEGYNDIQGNAAVGLISAELQELLPSLTSTLAFDIAALPHVSVVATRLFPGMDSPLVLARMWIQPMQGIQGFCGHIAAVNTVAVPSVLNLITSNLSGFMSAPCIVPVLRLFEGQTPIAMNMSVAANGSGTLVDYIDALQTHIYQLGCKSSKDDETNLILNGDFEEVAAARPTALPTGRNTFWGVQRGPATDLSSAGDGFDDRTRLSLSTADCWKGRHCGRVQLAGTSAVAVMAPYIGSNGTQLVRIHARSSPAGVRITIMNASQSLSIDWSEMATRVDNFEGEFLLTSPHVGGAVVWLDAAEAFLEQEDSQLKVAFV